MSRCDFIRASMQMTSIDSHLNQAKVELIGALTALKVYEGENDRYELTHAMWLTVNATQRIAYLMERNNDT